MSKLILVADDNDADAFAIGRALSHAGVKNSLKRVRDGEDVIAYFKGDGHYADRKEFPLPSVLLLDLKMPRIGGFAVIEWLNDQKKFRRAMQLVVLTSHYDIEKLRRASSLGAFLFLIKPCTVHDIRTLAEAYPSYWQMRATKQTLDAAIRKLGTGGASASAFK